MTKTTLLTIFHFATSIATTAFKLAEATEGDTPGTDSPAAEPTPTKRRGRPANTGTEGGTAAPEPEKEKPAAGGMPLEKLKELIVPVVNGGKGQKLKDFLAAHDAIKIADLAPEHHAAFAAEMKKLTLEVEAEQM